MNSKHLEKWIEKLDLELTIDALQKPYLLGTTRIIWKVLDMKWGKKKATTSKTTGWCLLLWHILPGNNTRSESKINKLIIIVIIIITITIIAVYIILLLIIMMTVL